MTGQIIERFQKIVDELKQDCQSVGKGLRGLAQGRWFLSRPADEAKPGKFDLPGRQALFDRTEAGNTFVEAINAPTEYIRQDLAISQVQSDMLASMERDFNQRHRSRIRRLAHEAVSKNHAGSNRGVFEKTILYYLQAQAKRVKKNKNG